MEHTLRNHLATKPKNWPATAQANPAIDTKWKILQSNTTSQRNNQTTIEWIKSNKKKQRQLQLQLKCARVCLRICSWAALQLLCLAKLPALASRHLNYSGVCFPTMSTLCVPKIINLNWAPSEGVPKCIQVANCRAQVSIHADILLFLQQA